MIVQFAQGVTCEWLYDGRIAVFTIPNTQPATIDAWGNAVLTTLANDARREQVLVMHDFSAPGSDLTFYLQGWSERLGTASPGIQGHNVLVLPNTLRAHIAKAFIEAQALLLQPDFKPKVVFQRAEGLAWLRQQLA